MAKMNKHEAIEAAKNMARRHEAVQAVTIDELSKIDYAARRELARNLMVSSAVSRIDTNAKYIPDAEQAFVDVALSIWSGKERALENKRRAWARMLTGITTEQAKAKIVTILKSFNIRGARVSEYGDHLVVERGRCSGQLYFRMDRATDFDGVCNPDDENQRAWEYTFSVKYSTSGTTYSPAEMAVMMKINQELLDAGNELTVMMNAERVIGTWGVPAVVEENETEAVQS